MIDAVYNTKLLELAGNVSALDRLSDADATAKAHSKLCGSTVVVDLKLDEMGNVSAYGQDVKACALGQASSAIMAQAVLGASADELRRVKSAAYAMLKDGAPPPSGRFSDLKYLEPVRDYKARHASTLLVFDAVVDALDQIAAKRGAA